MAISSVCRDLADHVLPTSPYNIFLNLNKGDYLDDLIIVGGVYVERHAIKFRRARLLRNKYGS